MHKKKRSVKQLANDRRLGRMAKKRGKKKATRRKNPKRSAKSHLWLIFRYGPGGAMFFDGSRFVKDKGKAVRFTTVKQASSFVEKAIDNESDSARGTSSYGVCDSATTASQLDKRMSDQGLFKRKKRRKA